MYNNLFWDSSKRILFIVGNFYNGIWFQEFGKIQQDMLKLQKITIIVDMRECIFISPTPFLSLLLTLKKVKDENKCEIIIHLPTDDNYEKRKFLNYCAREGFLEIINKIVHDKYDIAIFKEYNLIGTENIETLLNARIINMKECNTSVEELVNTLISEINESNLNVSKSLKLYSVIALRNILQELIDNVYKHAYYNENKFFAVYIRMRYATPSTIRKGNENNQYGELNRTTKPAEVYLHKAIEIYFQDIGKGIVRSYKEKKLPFVNHTNFDKRPLREIVNYVFFNENFAKRENNTSVNGLAFLRKILQEKNNYFSVYNAFEGSGTFGERSNKVIVNQIHMGDYKKEDICEIQGQIYNFTLFDRKTMDDEQTECLNGLLEVYQRKYEKSEYLMIDLRKQDTVLGKVVTNKVAFLFMPEYLTKNVIVNTIKEVLKNIPKIETLIISDVEDEELVLFDFSLDGLYKEFFKLNYKDIISITKIYVVTKSLKAHFFDGKERKFTKKKIGFCDFNNNYDYLYTLKKYESKELANILEKNAIGKYILTKGKIEWSDRQTFEGFINFDMLAANDICFDLLQRNLKRIMPLIENKKLYAIDTTVERLVSSINCLVNCSEREQYGVGSVFVSGMTLQSSDFKGNTIHFFSRGIGERQPALFFDPVYLYKSDSNEEQEAKYVRIGKSSRIKRKDIIEPIRNTNSYLNEKEMYKILHQYAYSSVLCGHLKFEKRHDLLSINLDAIMYDQSTRLKEYIEGAIKYSLGHYMNEKLSFIEYFEPLKNACMIVYPYNQLTSSILKKCSLNEGYKKYIIGLTPTNITSSGEDLEYSQCFTDYISECIKEYKSFYPQNELKVVIFDTLSYSGRTKQEIYEYLNSIEEVKPYFISIVDARVNHYPKNSNSLNYMNVNIPLLGKSETCKMCLVLNKLDAFKDNIIDASILAAIENLQSTWNVQDIRNYNEIIKLSNFDRIYAQNIVSYNLIDIHEKDALYFVNALPLYIFITNRIKLENDFSAMEFVFDNYKNKMESDSMAYILSLFILEYGETIYHSLLRKVCNFLLTYMRNSTELEVRQLVAIAILSLDEEKAEKIVLKCVEEDDKSVQSNLEGQVVFMYFLNRVKNYEDNGKIAFLYNKMKSGNNRLDLYKQFHCQLKNTNGNIHNSPLKRLIDEQESIENTRLAMASLSLLEQSLKCIELSFDMLYEESQVDSELSEEISQIRGKCLCDITELKSTINKKQMSKINKEKLEEVFWAGQKLHETLFAPYKVQTNSENRNIKSIDILLASIIEKYNDEKMKNKESTNNYPIFFDASYNSRVNVSKNIAAIYYIWNNMLVKEIQYAFDNLSKFVPENKTVITEDGNRSIGEVRIEITPHYFIISIYNNTDEDVKDIKKKAKQRYQKEVLGLLGVKFEYCENGQENPIFEDKALVTKIVVPNIQNGRSN